THRNAFSPCFTVRFSSRSESKKTVLCFAVTEFCIVCAAPRSGTTFLGDAVWRAYDAAWPEEIFYDVYLNFGFYYSKSEDSHERANCFLFRADVVRQKPELTYPHIDARRELFDQYLDYLRGAFQSDRFLIDIKYNSWHYLDGSWRNPMSPPGLIELIREKNI